MTLADAVKQAVGSIPSRRWALFAADQTAVARSFARSGNFAVQVSPSGDESWLLAKDRKELVFACGCTGASPRPVRHPVDRSACAELHEAALRAARAIVRHQAPLTDEEALALPLWASFPWNRREEAVAWAAGGNASLLTQTGGDEPIRWALLRWPVASRLPSLLRLRRPATQDRQVGWIRLDKEELWRDAFELCSRDEQSHPPSVDLQLRLGVVGLWSMDDLPAPVDKKKAWDRLCMRVARMIELTRPVQVHVGASPWTDAAVLWAAAQSRWSFRLKLHLPRTWDLDRGCFAVGDVDAYIEKLDGNPNYRGGKDAEEAMRRFFIHKDVGARLNRAHADACHETGFDSLRALSTALSYAIDDPERQVTYEEHDGPMDASRAVGRISTRILVTAWDRKTLAPGSRDAVKLCPGQLMWVTLDDLAGLRAQAPP